MFIKRAFNVSRAVKSSSSAVFSSSCSTASKNMFTRNYVTRQYASAASIAHSAIDSDVSQPSVTDNVVMVTLVDLDGNRHTVKGYVGQTLIDLAREHHLPLVADDTCAENCGCTLCHVIVSNEHYNTFPQSSEDENEMLQYAPSLSENSRLGCQLVLERIHDGLVISLPPRSTSSVTVDSFFRV